MDLITLLATAAGEKAHSETPFFLMGGAFAAFAIVVGALGVARPNWGGSAMNAVMGVGALLTVGTMVAMVAIS